MSTVPPLNPALAQLLAQAANAPAVQIVQPPTAISTLPAGSIVEAIVMSLQPQPPGGAPAQTNAPSTNTLPPNFTPNITMQTGAGIITARTPIQLPEGTRVELEIFRTANNQVSARLITVNNVSIQSAQILTSQNATPSLQNPALSTQNTALKAPILPVGQALTPAGPVNLVTLGPISAFVILSSPTPPQTAQPASILGTLNGTVSSLSATGAPIVQIDTPQMQGQVQLNVRANIPIGTVVTFEVTAQTPTQTGAASGPPSPSSALQPNSPLGTPGIPQIATGQFRSPTAQHTLATPEQPGTVTSAQQRPGLTLPGPTGLPPTAPTPPQTAQPASILGTLNGTVSSLSATGAPIVQIDTPQMQGQVQLNVRANIPIGTVVTFEVTAQTPTQTGAASGPPSPSSALQPNSPLGTPGIPQSALSPISAPGTSQSAIPIQLFTGNELTIRLTAVQIQGSQNPQIATEQFRPPTTQHTLASPEQTSTLPSAQQRPGLTLPGPTGPPPTAPTPPQTVQPASILGTLNGTVSSLSATGAPIVQIDTPQMQGQVQLNVRANIPIGTVVTFEVTAQTPTQTGATSGPPSPFTVLPLSGPAGAFVGWPTLVEALTLLQRTDPAAAQQLAQSIPDGGSRTAVAVMAFVHALRTGDPRQWPGDTNLRAIERTSPRGAHLAAQLSGEVSELAARTRDAVGEWRSIPIPWNAEGRIERINLVTRREEAQENKEKEQKGSKGTRFLINLDLSRLGPLQLDGMFRKETQTFDMMIRTKKILADNMRRDLTGMFANTNAAMGLKGGLTFQVMRRFPDPVDRESQISQGKPGLWA